MLKEVFKIFASFTIVWCSFTSFSQGYVNIWPMGLNTSVEFVGSGFNFSNNFNTGSAALACMNDASGNLLFYCPAQNIINANHNIMPNGDSIKVHISSEQGAIALPFLSDPDRHFLFQVEAGEVSGEYGFNYSVIDMSLDGGLGDVPLGLKNIPISPNANCEGIAATAHRDGQRAWVVMHDLPSPNFRFLLVGDTIEAIIERPSNVFYGGANTAVSSTYMFSPNGKYLASALYADSTIELYRFNNANGTLDHITDILFETRIRAIEFSSNSNFIYTASSEASLQSTVFQIDLKDFTTTNIADIEFARDLQLDPQKRILVSTINPFKIGAILQPNNAGAASNYIDSILTFAPLNVGSNFPNWISNWFNTSFCVENACVADSTEFYFAGYRMDSAIWDFGDPASGPLNVGSGQEPKHVYSNPGDYQVTLLATTGGSTDTIVQTVSVVFPLDAGVLKDTTYLCSSQPAFLSAFQLGAEYAWGNGSDSSAILVNDTGWYVCTITNACTTIIDSSFVRFVEPLNIDLGTDTFLCDSAAIELNGFSVANVESFMWSSGDTSSTALQISHSESEPFSVYWLTATNACGTSSDTIRIEFLPQPNVSWFSDSILCDQSEAIVNTPIIDSVTFFMTYTTDDIAYDTLAQPWIIDTFRLYYMHAFNQCDTVVKRAFLSPFNVIDVSLGADTVLCPGDSVALNAFWPTASYVWNAGSQDSTLSVSFDELQSAGSTIYTVTITNGTCERIASRTLSVDDLVCDTAICKFSIPNVFSPNGDGINDVLKISNTCTNISYAASIYNRWGQLIYSDERAKGNSPVTWDGFINGIATSEGTYFAIIQYEGKVQKGSFTLVR
ncbi:gliding motility-associated C-terminal domain-containing protein [Salibacteraceae bacterium]|nr:gliding motility-associated C-terminal domain-containing protein [Salibacteraceae bacterium]